MMRWPHCRVVSRTRAGGKYFQPEKGWADAACWCMASLYKRIALYDADKTGFQNIALLKIATHYKALGYGVEWFHPLLSAGSKVFVSSVFSWTPRNPYIPSDAIMGGSGHSFSVTLPEAIEHARPDYEFAGIKHGIGFTTRGCPKRCAWCIVPQKEGDVRAHADIEEFINPKSRDIVLMDNNVLAHDHGVVQIEKMSRLGLRVDFNQGLDAIRIDEAIARRLAALRWLKPARLACDHKNQMPVVEKAVRLLRSAGVSPREYSCYVLVKDIDDAHYRVEFLRSLGVVPFAQPYRDPHSSSPPTREQRRFARWVNHRAVFKTVPWSEYRNRNEIGVKNVKR